MRKKSNKPTKAQKERMGRLKYMPCIVCGYSPVEVQHCNTKMGLKKDHDATISLCFEHHRGKMGIHTIGRRLWEKLFGSEDELLIKTNKLLGL